MDPRVRRRNVDLEKLKKFRDEHAQIIKRIAVSGNPFNKLKLLLNIPTSCSEAYPDVIQNNVEAEIELPFEYPHSPPHVHIVSQIWNPNVYTNGTVCIGSIWIASEGMDLFLIKIIRLLAYDPQIVNPNSPANYSASTWYLSRKKQYPQFFPTMDISTILIRKPKENTITWTNIK